jgi:hypothetical protein
MLQCERGEVAEAGASASSDVRGARRTLITTMSDGFRIETLTLIQERHVIRPFDTLMHGTGYDCLRTRIGNWYNRAYVANWVR